MADVDLAAQSQFFADLDQKPAVLGVETAQGPVKPPVRGVVKWVGIAAVVLEQIQNIPEIVRVFQTQDTTDLAWGMIIVGVLSSAAWAYYAGRTKDRWLLISSIMSGVSFLVLLGQKIAYDKPKDTGRGGRRVLTGKQKRKAWQRHGSFMQTIDTLNSLARF